MKLTKSLVYLAEVGATSAVLGSVVKSSDTPNADGYIGFFEQFMHSGWTVSYASANHQHTLHEKISSERFFERPRSFHKE